MDRTILHCDCNAFYASVECVLNPELKKVPMAVGGDEESRHGIILAKNELAKKYNIQTAETIWQAKKKCPDLVIVRPHHDLYYKYSKQVMDIYKRYTDYVESFGPDEAWLDVTGSKRLFGDGVKIANELRRIVREETGLTECHFARCSQSLAVTIKNRMRLLCFQNQIGNSLYIRCR